MEKQEEKMGSFKRGTSFGSRRTRHSNLDPPFYAERYRRPTVCWRAEHPTGGICFHGDRSPERTHFIPFPYFVGVCLRNGDPLSDLVSRASGRFLFSSLSLSTPGGLLPLSRVIFPVSDAGSAESKRLASRDFRELSNRTLKTIDA